MLETPWPQLVSGERGQLYLLVIYEDFLTDGHGSKISWPDLDFDPTQLADCRNDMPLNLARSDMRKLKLKSGPTHAVLYASALIVRQITEATTLSRLLGYSKLVYQRGSMVRTSVFGWRTFPNIRLILTGDNFVSKLGQPTKPTQPSILTGSVTFE